MSEPQAPFSTDHLSPLNPEFKERWVEALRSGKYKQTEGRLQKCGGYCCLGVAACLIDPNGWDGNEFRGDSHVLDDATMGEIGLSPRAHDWLTSMNDNGESFETIANYIEANL